MGREIRKVPPNWEHPQNEENRGQLQPMYDRPYAEAKKEWLDALAEWEAGVRPDYFDVADEPMDYWEWDNGPPDRKYYRPWSDEEATWFQVWETVTEGTPVTPPFGTEQELADYLADNGDFWDQERCTKSDWKSLWGGTPGVSGWGKERAAKFVFGGGWTPSMIVSGGKVITNPGDMIADVKAST